MKAIKLKINSAEDRKMLVQGLTDSGYKTYVSEEDGKHSWERDYYVIFEINENSILTNP